MPFNFLDNLRNSNKIWLNFSEAMKIAKIWCFFLKEKLAQLEVENNKLQDNLANLQKLNIDEAAKKELALQLIKTLKEPYDAIKKIMEDMKNEVGQLSRGKMNELRRMTKPPLLIKKTLELGK